MIASNTSEELPVEPKDRPLNAFRLPKTDKVKGLIVEVLAQIKNYEEHFALRKRGRRAVDQAIFERIVTAVICDLTHAHLSPPSRKLYVSLSKRTDNRVKRYIPPSFGNTLPDVLKCLASNELSFIVMEKGHQGLFGTSKQTTVKAGARLMSRIDDYEIQLIDLEQDINQETIILKKVKDGHWDSGEWLDYEDNATTNIYRHEMYRINDWLSKADIDCGILESHKEVDELDRLLRRTFNRGSFESGGRLFGGFWQGLKKIERASCMRINGQPVATLDYSQTAPKIAYSMAGITPPTTDAYAIPLYDNTKLRKSVKKVFNSLLYSDKPISRFPQGTRDEFDRRVKFAHLMDKIEEVHKPIAHFFGTGVGLKIMFIESQILVKALLDCIDNKIVALPVHDALIVSESDIDKTRIIMLKAFKDITGIDGQVEQE